MSAPPVLELDHATVEKDGRAVLDDLSLTIREGEHTAIVGANGAGKSVLVGLLTHHERAVTRADGIAAVRVFGESSWPVADLRTKLGIVSPALHQLFVHGNSEGRITEAMHQRAAEALAQVGAAHLAERTLNRMSGGEARRVMLARALVGAPRALVLDEPTGGLDMAARHAFMERVRGLARAGTTLVLITHHVEEIVPEVTRVLFLKGGRLVADGSRAAMLSAPRLSDLFDLPLAVDDVDGYVFARPASGTRVTA